MKKIIILNKKNESGQFEVNYIFWLSVPTAQQSFRVNPQATSQYSGASLEEITSLQNGTVLEVGGKASYLPNTTNTQIGTDLVARFNVAQLELNNDDKFKYFGTFFDGTSWTIQGA